MRIKAIHNASLLACAFWICAQIGGAPAEAAVSPDTTTRPSNSATEAPGIPEAAQAPAGSGRGIAPSPGRLGFSGFFESRLRSHQYAAFAPWMGPDAAGSLLAARLGLGVSITADAHVGGRAAVILTDDFSGRFLNSRAGKSPRRVAIPGMGEGADTAVADGLRHPDGQGPEGGAGIFEELMAEIDLRSAAADARLRAGTAVWTRGSPLTLWNRDPRPKHAWYFEEFEPEASSIRYYEAKAFTRGADLGRHAWPDRALAGFALESTRLPLGLDLRLGAFSPSDILPTRLAGESSFQAEGRLGSGNSGGLASRGGLHLARIGHAFSWARLRAGINVLAASLPADLINQREKAATPARGFVRQFKGGRAPFLVNPRVAGFEASGDLGVKLAFHAEAALSLDDTVRFLPVPGTDSLFDGRGGSTRSRGPPSPAGYLRIEGRTRVPFLAEFFYASPAFHSPWSMAGNPVRGYPRRDGISLDAGSFRYQANLAGLGIRLSPEMPEGFLVFTAGQHVQIVPDADVIRFRHELNGREMWESTKSSTRRDAARLLDEGLPRGNPRYDARLGDFGAAPLPLLGEARPGGLRGGPDGVWEEFAAYPDKAKADAGIAPETRKFASSLALDWGYRFNSWLGTWRPMLLNAYAAVDAIGTDPTAILNNDRAFLWHGLLRAEPALSLTSDFHVLALAGLETWKSRPAWRNALANRAEAGRYDNRNAYDPLSVLGPSSQNALLRVDAAPSPIDYRQIALGLGCDWDFAARAGLHLRIKHAAHADAGLPGNDWSGWFLFMGLKLWI